MESQINDDQNTIKCLESPERSLCISNLEKEIDLDFKVENINEAIIFYPSIDQKVNFSYMDNDEDYFAKPLPKETSIIQESNRSTSNLSKKDFQLLPNKSQIDINQDQTKSSPLPSENNNSYYNFNKHELDDEHKMQFKKNEELTHSKVYSVLEKCEVKDYIGFHKLYEILFFDDQNEKNIKCYRRYDNFHKFHEKISRIYPFILIPKITPKNPLSKIISPEEDFYINRRTQLELYLNYIAKNKILIKTKEFHKFINDAEFDDEFFSSNYDENAFLFPNSLKITDNLKNKIFSVFSGIFGDRDGRKLSNEEITLARMETHYKGITEKYTEIKNNVISYLKSVKINRDCYTQLSNTFLYLKDSLEDIPNAKEKFKNYQEICISVSLVNEKNYINKSIEIENNFEVSLLS
jgi:hypothetical protein